MDIYGRYIPPVMPITMPAQMPTKVPSLAGRDGVEKLTLPPDSSIIAIDANDPIVWYIETDSVGAKKTIAPFTITPYKPEEPEDINTRLARIEERLARYESNFIADRADQPGHADDQ